MKQARSFLPVAIDFPEAAARQAGWGRWIRLASNGGRISTRFQLKEGDAVFLSFELAGRSIERLPARVDSSRQDDDGWWAAEVRFSDAAARSGFGRLLRELLA